MKSHDLFHWVAVCAALVAGANAKAAQPTNKSVTSVREAGPHHRVWEWSETDDQGQPSDHSYTELATGLNVWNPDSAQWEESDPTLVITDEGFAVSRRTQHQLTISPRINAADGAVKFRTPDDQLLRSTVLGLSLFNRRTGNTLALAGLKAEPSPGELVASNAVVWRDCFDNLRADVRVENRRDGFHHDVILREALDGKVLKAAGFPPEDCLLETWTEWLEAPEPKLDARVVSRIEDPVKRAAMTEPDIIDEMLDFGVMAFPAGVAYLAPDREPGREVPVFKRWIQRDGQRFLVESCELSALQPLLAALPEPRDGEASREGRMISGRHPPTANFSAPGG